MKKCTQCGEIKPLSDFYTNGKHKKNGEPCYRGKCKQCELENKKVKLEDRKIVTSEIANDPIYKKCKQMANDAYARVYCPSREYKTCYRNLNNPFGFLDSGELKHYLYDNFYNNIKTLLDQGLVPSIDRIDATQGYIIGNIRILEFAENTKLGLNTIRKQVKVTSSKNEVMIFSSVTECGAYFGYKPTEISRISGWCKNDCKYIKPEGFMFEYV